MSARLPALALLLAGLCAAQAVPTTLAHRRAWIVKRAGTTNVATTFYGQNLDISIHAWQVAADTRSPDAPRPYPACTYTQNPCSITDTVQVTLGGRRLWVFADLFSDLADMHYVSVTGKPGHFVLILAGGDTVESYDAHLIFNHGEVVKRILYDGPDEGFAYEVTVYHRQDFR